MKIKYTVKICGQFEYETEIENLDRIDAAKKAREELFDIGQDWNIDFEEEDIEIDGEYEDEEE